MQVINQKIIKKEAILGVIGLGYVGLPLAVEKAKAGFKTIGFDIQNTKVEKVNNGENYIGDVVDEDLEILVSSGLLSATNDYSKISQADCVCICVPTPLDRYQQPDISYVKNSVESILPFLHKDMLIILESTTYPGTTRELILPLIESTGLKCGKDIFLAFSPERVDPGNLIYKTKNTPKVVGGITEECTALAATLYESILEAPVHRVSSPEVAEMEKILENIYRNINIGLINEIAILSHRMNINIWEVIEAAKSKPYGFQAFYPGPGLGGHCIPLDPYYLSWKAREYGFHTSMIESSMMINDNMPQYVIDRISKILNRQSKSIKSSRVLLLGIAYKQDIDDYRESPAVKVFELLKAYESDVSFFDPYIEKFTHGNSTYIGYKEITEEIIKSFDIIVCTTAHTNVDYIKIQENAVSIFDTKNAFKNVLERSNIELL